MESCLKGQPRGVRTVGVHTVVPASEHRSAVEAMVSQL